MPVGATGFAGGRDVLGYRPEGQRGNPGKGALRLIEQEAEAIRLIFAMRDQGMTLQKIAGELNAQGFRTKAGAEIEHLKDAFIQELVERTKALPAPEPTDQKPESPKRRRWWPFGGRDQ